MDPIATADPLMLAVARFSLLLGRSRCVYNPVSFDERAGLLHANPTFLHRTIPIDRSLDCSSKSFFPAFLRQYVSTVRRGEQSANVLDRAALLAVEYGVRGAEVVVGAG
jgi:hypothetical protein